MCLMHLFFDKDPFLLGSVVQVLNRGIYALNFENFGLSEDLVGVDAFLGRIHAAGHFPPSFLRYLPDMTAPEGSAASSSQAVPPLLTDNSRKVKILDTQIPMVRILLPELNELLPDSSVVLLFIAELDEFLFVQRYLLPRFRCSGTKPYVCRRRWQRLRVELQ